MREERIVEMLKAEGIEAIVIENHKGRGIALGNKSVKPTIYLKYLQSLTDDEVVNKAKVILENSKCNDIASQVKEIFTVEGLSKNLILCIQPKTDEEMIKRDWNDLELVMKVEISLNDGKGFIKIHQEILDKVGMDIDEAWKIAERNTCDKTKMDNLSEILNMFIGNSKDSGLYILTTEYESAAAVINKDALRSFCLGRKVKRMYLIPSSIHEWILSPENMDIETIGSMIREVNQTIVEEEEILSNHVYIYDFDKDEITY